jgi:hypothetical protein
MVWPSRQSITIQLKFSRFHSSFHAVLYVKMPLEIQAKDFKKTLGLSTLAGDASLQENCYLGRGVVFSENDAKAIGCRNLS